MGVHCRILSRNQLLAAALGLLLIAFGLFQSQATEGPSPDRTNERAAPESEPVATRPDTRDAPSRRSAVEGRRAAAPGKDVRAVAPIIHVQLVLGEGSVPDDAALAGQPAAGARVGLWRMASGDGVSFRPARRIVPDVRTGADGMTRFKVPLGVSLELTAQAAGDGPPIRHELGALDDGITAPILLTVEPPLAELQLIVRSTQGEPVPGASIRTAPHEPGPVAEFPGSATTLVHRSGGDGRCTLAGTIRNAGWVLVDASGFSPAVLPAETVAKKTSITVVLEPEAVLEVQVTDAAGGNVAAAIVSVRFRLKGYPSLRQAKTDSQGKVTIKGLPANTQLLTNVRLGEQFPQSFEAINLSPGERKAATLALDSPPGGLAPETTSPNQQPRGERRQSESTPGGGRR